MADPRPRSESRAPVFLERRSYRRRRVADAARAVPVVGGILILMPLLWPEADGVRMSTVSAFLYIFGVWALMILLAALMAPFLSRRDED